MPDKIDRDALAAFRRFFTIRSLPLAVLTRVQPGCNLVHDALMDLLRRHTGALRNFERMITAFDHVKLSGQAKLLNHSANFFFCSKRIARAWHEELLRSDIFQMRVAQLIRLARRMQWIAKQ